MPPDCLAQPPLQQKALLHQFWRLCHQLKGRLGMQGGALGKFRQPRRSLQHACRMKGAFSEDNSCYGRHVPGLDGSEDSEQKVRPPCMSHEQDTWPVLLDLKHVMKPGVSSTKELAADLKQLHGQRAAV